VISTSDARAIRNELATGRVTQRELARRYGVSPATISRLVRGLRHADAGGPIIATGSTLPWPRKLAPLQMEEALASAEGHSAVARRLGVSRQAIQQLRDRWGWRARWTESTSEHAPSSTA
jgi:DNA-binding XRE family transcriptional regulator